MEQKKILVKADGFVIQVLTNCDELEMYMNKFQVVLNKLTLKFDIINDYEKVAVDGVVVYYNDNEYKLTSDIEKKEIILKCPWEKINDCTLFAMVFRYFVEFLRQSNGEIKLHASAVCKDKKTALFLAPSEGGKTTTAMAMCQNYGYFLRANDASVSKFFDDEPFMLRGDCVINARMNGLEAYSTSMYREVMNKEKGISNPWNQKTNLDPTELGMSIDTEKRKITHLFFVKLDVLIDKVSVTKYSATAPDIKKNWFKHKMEIYQNIGGTLKGTDFFPSGNGGEILPIVIPSMDSDELNKERIIFLSKLFESCEIYEVRGKLEEVTETINEIMQKI